MPRRNEHFGVSFSDDGATMVFTVTRPRRVLGVFLICLPLLFAALVIRFAGESISHLAKDPGFGLFFLGLVIAVTLGCLLPGLYFMLRRQRALVNAREVILESRSLYSRQERHPLTDFVGLEQSTEKAITRDLWAVIRISLGAVASGVAAGLGYAMATTATPQNAVNAITVVLVAAVSFIGVSAGPLGVVMGMGKRVRLHCLSLVPRRGAGIEVPLVTERDPAAIDAIMAEFSQRFSLGLVAPSLDTQSGEVDPPLGERVAADGAAARPLPAPPERLRVVESEGETIISLPQMSEPIKFIGSLCLGGPPLAFTFFVLYSDPTQFDLAVVLVALAVGIPAIALYVSRKPKRLTLGPEGLRFEGVTIYPQMCREIRVPWDRLRLVSVAAPTIVHAMKGRSMLSVVCDAGDFYLARPRLREEELQWLAEAITNAARRFGHGSGEGPAEA